MISKLMPVDVQYDFHTRRLKEHAEARYVETLEDIQRKIDEILRKRR